MLEVCNKESLVFTFPEISKDVKFNVRFQRTIRVPDDGKEYPLPAGLGSFPIKHIEDYENKLPDSWAKHGGVMLPVHENEALWINFSCSYIQERRARYPFAVMVGTGKINAINGTQWSGTLDGQNQNYVVSPGQPWIDGYRVGNGVVRQFVSVPLGEGATVEEQITGSDVHGGIQIQVFPMKLDVFKSMFPVISEEDDGPQVMYSLRKASSGLGAGGLIKQKIYPDPFDINDWDEDISSRVFVHLLNADIWKDVTGECPPPKPAGAWLMNEAGVPWFKLNDESCIEIGSSGEPFSKIGSVGKFISKQASWLLGNIGFKPKNIVSVKCSTAVKESGEW